MKNYRKLYLQSITKKADVKKPLKVVFDCSNGTTSAVFKGLKIKNVKLIFINNKLDGNFPAHGPNPLEPGAMKQVEKAVVKNEADLGAVFDGDADRVFFIDNKGRFLPSYVTAHLLAMAHKPPFVADIFTFNPLIYMGTKKRLYPSRVGYYFMSKTAKRHKASFGAEWSNHYSFRETYYADSALLAAIRVMNILSKLPYSLADFFDLLPDFHYEQFNKKTGNPSALMKKIVKVYQKRVTKRSRLDGYLFDFREWFLIVRPSNTEPLLRLFVGSRNKKIFRRELKKLKSLS
ncbi:MAG: hypothetical protein HY378_01670 [Candidatus Brennerbacteria bacterium]|nr:hypothetical protein [Candidatus Brennerbacteria bacterium]